MYRCDSCGKVFEDPDILRITENLDGENGWCTHTEEYCPRCGSQDFEDADEDDEEDEE